MNKRCAFYAAYQCFMSLCGGLGWLGTGYAGFLFIAGVAFGAAFVIAALGFNPHVKIGEATPVADIATGGNSSVVLK